MLGRPKPDFMLDSLMGAENSAKSHKLVKTSTISHETKQIKKDTTNWKVFFVSGYA